jgi:hypothetical protein
MLVHLLVNWDVLLVWLLVMVVLLCLYMVINSDDWG